MTAYSPWFQEKVRNILVAKLNADPDTEFRLGSLSIDFPLDVSVGDLLMVSHGDTLIRADAFTGNMQLMPLLAGRVDIDGAHLAGARYQIGSLDSASRLIIEAQDMRLAGSTVQLSPMRIDVSAIDIDTGLVDLWINSVDTIPPTPPSETQMNINVDRINYRDLTFRMQLMPTIDTLRTNIAEGVIESTRVDLAAQTVDVGTFNGKRMDVRYIIPDSAAIAACPVVVSPDPANATPWIVRVGRIDMTDSHALYATANVHPLPGLDFEYIEANQIDLAVDSFYNCAADVRVPFDLCGIERSGIDLRATGILDIDSVGIDFRDFTLKTANGSDIAFNGYLGTEEELTTPDVPLRLDLNGDIATADVSLMFPDTKPLFVGLRDGAGIDADMNIGGTSGQLGIERLRLNIDRHIDLTAKGTINNIFADKGFGGDIDFRGAVIDVSTWTRALLAGTGILIPAMRIDGNATFDDTDYTADITAKTMGGSIALVGGLKGSAEKYDIDIDARALPVNAFMPDLGVGRLTGRLTAQGRGFDFLKPSTVLNAAADIDSVIYNNKKITDITFNADIAAGHADIDLTSGTEGVDAHLTAQGNLNGDRLDWKVSLTSNGIDLGALGLSETPATVITDLDLHASLTPNLRNVLARLDLHSLKYTTSESDLDLDNVKVLLDATDSVTNLNLFNRDMMAYYSSPLPLDSVMGRVDRVSATIANNIERRRISVVDIQRAIMPFRLDVNAGNDNALIDILQDSDMSFERLNLEASNDSSLFLTGRILGFRSGKTRLDTVDLNIRQRGERLDYVATVNNRPGTFDQWAHVDVNGYFKTGQLGINLKQRNIKDKVGFDLGAMIKVNPDSTMTLRFDNLAPVVNYRQWSVNADNFIKYDFRHRHLDADVRMKSDVSRIALYTEHANDTAIANHGHDEDLILQVFDIQLQDWMSINPFAPPVKGNLSAGMRINWEDTHLTGSGTVALTDFLYGKERVGDLRADIDLLTTRQGLLKTNVDMWVNGEKTMTLSGALNDSTLTSPFNLDFKMIHFPLKTLNPFLPGVARLGGTLNGSMDISGDSNQPVINGYLAFDDAKVDVVMLGSTLTMAADTIPVRENFVTLDNFTIKGENENPLAINGYVDIKSLSSPRIDLTLTADNMQIVNTNRARRGADVYGKAFIGLDATAKGNLDILNVDADLALLPGTNVTYVMAGGASALENRANDEMVKFVNFNDTAAVTAADSVLVEGTILNLRADLDIRTGSTINVDLGTSPKDRVQIQGSGQLNYVSSPIGNGSLTGRFNFSGGYFRYAPPLISNLDFTFNEGSYVAFNGNMMNPRLNVTATERMRANVSQAGQNSRLIYFDIILKVLGTLEQLDVSFDLATDDDITVANELASMSATQRASEAMNLLLYNTYTGGSTKATSNLNGNPLFSFVTNQLNSWAANNIRGIDLSFGIDQFDRTTDGSTSTTTQYSYRVSKSLFDDRFKIVVGGNYSTDANADENFAQNLINDISFEYILNDARTMYVRLFRHTGYESILEGEITQTGVGFVYKKKINRLLDMFRTHPHHGRKADKDKDKTPMPVTTPDVQPAKPTDDEDSSSDK